MNEIKYVLVYSSLFGKWKNRQKKKEQKLSGEKSERGKFSVQNWQSDPMNSPKAFGELKIDMHHNKKWDFIEATPQKKDLSIT